MHQPGFDLQYSIGSPVVISEHRARATLENQWMWPSKKNKTNAEKWN